MSTAGAANSNDFFSLIVLPKIDFESELAEFESVCSFPSPEHTFTNTGKFVVIVSPGHAVQPFCRSPWRNSTPPRVEEKPRDDTEDWRDVQASCDDTEVKNSSSDVENSSLEAVGPRTKSLVFTIFSADSIDADVPTLPLMCREPSASTARSSSWRDRQSTVVVLDLIA